MACPFVAVESCTAPQVLPHDTSKAPYSILQGVSLKAWTCNGLRSSCSCPFVPKVARRAVCASYGSRLLS